MKRFMLLLLCLPLILTFCIECYYLVERETLGRTVNGPLADKRSQDSPEVAKRIVRDLADLQATAFLVTTSPKNNELPSDPQRKELASALVKHGQAVHDAWENMNALSANKPEELTGKYKEWQIRLNGPELDLANLKTILANTMPENTKIGSELQKRISACRSKWEPLKSGDTAKRASQVIGFLKSCERVAKLIGTSSDDIDFSVLEGLANSELAEDELRLLARKLAVRAAKEYWSPSQLPYDSFVEVRDNSKAWLKRTNTQVWVNDVKIKDNPKLQFQEGQLYIDELAPYSFKEANQGPRGYQNRMRPTKKSAAAFAYNNVLEKFSGATSLRGIESSLLDEYRRCVARNTDPVVAIETIKGAFVVQELTTHYKEEGKKLKQLLEIVQDCPTLFP